MCAAGLCMVLVTVPFVSAGGQAQSTSTAASTGTAPPTAPSAYRVIQASAGSKQVERNGRLYFEDPRNIFRLGDDHKVVVEFEWDGPSGAHKFQAMWKDPSGKVVVVTNFDFAPKGAPFSGLFTMLMDETAATGIWTVDATIDGQSAGTYSFEIVAADSAVPAPQPPARIPLTPADIYKHALDATVFVDKLGADGKVISRGSGFFLKPEMLLTTFENIDGASNLRVVFPSGRSQTTDKVVAWDRWQDWAILIANATDIAALRPVERKSWNVGDRCYSLGISAGGRIIVEGGILGDITQPRVGERLSLSFAAEPASLGSPVLNEFGDVIGMLGGGFLASLQRGDAPPQTNALPMPNDQAATASLAVPLTTVTLGPAEQAPSALADLAAKGMFLPVLQASSEVGFGTLSSGLDKKGGGPGSPLDWRNQFSLGDRRMLLYVNWEPKKKFKGMATARFFDLDNKELGQSPPLKLNLQPGNPVATNWTISLGTFVPGTYRVDVYLGDAPAWREYFRITP